MPRLYISGRVIQGAKVIPAVQLMQAGVLYWAAAIQLQKKSVHTVR